MNSPDNSISAIGYFLRELSDEERDSIEERLFSDTSFSEYFDEVEYDLIDDYVRGEMDVQTRQRFESRYLTTEKRRLRVAAAGTLSERIQQPVSERASVRSKVSFWDRLLAGLSMPRLSLAGGVAVLVLFGILAGWLLTRSEGDTPLKADATSNDGPIDPPSARNSDMGSIVPGEPDPRKEVETGKPAAGNIPPATKTNRGPAAPPSPRKPSVFAIALSPGVRSGDRPTFAVPPSADLINISVVHGNVKEFAQYQAEIFDQDGVLILLREYSPRSGLLPDPISIRFRGTRLKQGPYELKLTGISMDGEFEELNYYNFEIGRP